MGTERVIFQQLKSLSAGMHLMSGPYPPQKKNSDKFSKSPQIPISVTSKDIMLKEDALKKKGVKKEEEKFVEEETKKAQQKLEELVTKTRMPILKVKAVWPFDFFPDEILVDTEKVDIINRTFFWSKQVKCVMLKNIFDVIVETSLLFATLRLIDKNYIEQESSIRFLWKSQAMKAKNIIQGLVTAVSEGIDVTKCDTDDLVRKATKIGTTGK